MNRKKTNEKGITLIALVISIIVMLILAGVTINTVIDGGLIGYAQNAKRDSIKAQDEEAISIGIALYTIENNEEFNLGDFGENIAEYIDEAELIEYNEIRIPLSIIIRIDNDNNRWYKIEEDQSIEQLSNMEVTERLQHIQFNEDCQRIQEKIDEYMEEHDREFDLEDFSNNLPIEDAELLFINTLEGYSIIELFK